MLYPSDINYVPFSDEQIEGFARCADIEYASDLWWRDDLNDAARDLIIGHFSQKWDSPSEIVKALTSIAKNPHRFFEQLGSGRAGAIPDPVATALRHGTGWTDEQLLDAANRRDEFLRGVATEIAFLARIEDQRKAMLEKAGRKRWSSPDMAMIAFVNELAFIYQDAFLSNANEKLTVTYATSMASKKSDASSVSGPFIRFSKAVIAAIGKNLDEAVTRESPDLQGALKRIAMPSDTSLWKRFERSEYIGLMRKPAKG